ncbi:UNVERIFIED_CONTAM: hypothetical protein GTU68_064595 [Idotea baltica]|nr:hypothetical protein [Idotea baltica]
MFDNSFVRGAPFVFAVSQQEVIQGWDMALGVLKKGTKATLFIPAKFGYGEKGNGPIKANSDLAFYIEI